MSETKPYKVTNPDTQWICGSRVNTDGTIALTEQAAAFDLARGNIALVEGEPEQPRDRASERTPVQREGNSRKIAIPTIVQE